MLWLAAACGLQPGNVHWTCGDAHVYEVHIPLAERIIKTPCGPQDLSLRWVGGGRPFVAEGFKLTGAYLPILEDKACPVS